MKQLSGVDAAFLHMETSKQFGHVSSIIVVDPSTSRTGDVYGDLRAALDERIHLLDVYRRKLVTDPLGLDHPYWVDDPDLDLEFHVREIALPAPGNDQQLAEQVSRIVARPLDRSRPLWEFYVISGRDDGSVAILNKVHHSTIDGVSGAEMLNVLLDAEPDGRVVEPPTRPWRPERTPSPIEMLGRSLLSYTVRPTKAIELQVEMWRMVARLSGNSAFRQTVRATLPGLRRLGLIPQSERPKLPNGLAPRTSFNGTIGPHRRFAFCTLHLSEVQAIKRAYGVTLNDVVLELCADALRRYLRRHDELPEESLVAMVPVSMRTGNEKDVFTTRVTGVMTSLETHLDDPVERLQGIHEAMAAAKDVQQAVPATMLTDLTRFTPPILAAQAARLGSMVQLANRLSWPFNLIISNVPGPRETLYLAGSEMTHFYPVSTVADGMGLNMTVQSYRDNLDFGFIADRDLVPDLWILCDHLREAMDELSKAATER